MRAKTRAGTRTTSPPHHRRVVGLPPPHCRVAAEQKKIGTVALGAEERKIRRASGAAGDKGDLISSSLLLLGHNKIKIKTKIGLELTLRRGYRGGETEIDGGRYGRRRTSGGRDADGGGRRWTAVDSSGQRWTTAEGGCLAVEDSGGCDNWLWSGGESKTGG